MTIQPQDLSDADVIFAANVRKLMPRMADIPKEFSDSHNPFVELTSQWFFSGLNKNKLDPKTEIDAYKAFRHLATILHSFEPQHEHKIAAVAYLMSLWFTATEEKKKVKK